MKKTFSHLLRDDPDLDERAVKEALIVLDTNVLLNLYGGSHAHQDACFDALDKVRDRLWIPHQVGIEFYSNRVEETKEAQGRLSARRDRDRGNGEGAQELWCIELRGSG